MGCGASTTVHADSSVSSFDFSRRNTLVKRPEVGVEIGEGVKKLNKNYRIVFIFGKTLLFYSFLYPFFYNCFFDPQSKITGNYFITAIRKGRLI